MLKALFNIFSGKRREQMKEALKNGALIIDVRSPMEYQSGHVKGSKNYPLDTIDNQLKELKAAGKSIIFCCASGMRSGMATSKAQAAGIDAFNGGPWTSVNAMVD